MSRTSNCLVRGAALAALASLCNAQADLLGIDSGIGARLAALANQVGEGGGVLRMPTTHSHGAAQAVLVDAQGAVRYVLEAELSTFIPLSPGQGQRVAFGGIYGVLLDAQSSGPAGAPLVVGSVSGLWRMERDLQGNVDALVHVRGAGGTVHLAGRIQGAFDMRHGQGNGGGVGMTLSGTSLGPSQPASGVSQGVSTLTTPRSSTPFVPGISAIALQGSSAMGGSALQLGLASAIGFAQVGAGFVALSSRGTLGAQSAAQAQPQDLGNAGSADLPQPGTQLQPIPLGRLRLEYVLVL